MKLYKKIIMVAALCCLIILIERCSSSSLVDVWKDPSYHDPPLKKIFVIAIRKDQVQRRIWEDAFVSELSKHGVAAIPSYSLFQNVLPDTNQVIQTVQEKGFDGILITRLLIRETEIHYVESYVTSEMRTRYSTFRKKYSTFYQDVQHPAYIDGNGYAGIT